MKTYSLADLLILAVAVFTLGIAVSGAFWSNLYWQADDRASKWQGRAERCREGRP